MLGLEDRVFTKRLGKALPDTPTPHSKPAVKPKLTTDQRNKYSSLLEKVKGFTEIQSDQEGISGVLTDREKLWLTRECLLRYLRATNWAVDESASRLLSTLTWRREYGLYSFTSEYVSPEQESGKLVILGFDYGGQPCQYLNLGLRNTDPSPRRIHHIFYMVERGIDIMPPGVEMMRGMINCKPGKRRFNVPLSTAREVLHIWQNHYPGRLGEVLIINMPWILWGVFKAISPFIDPITRDKVKFEGDMTQHVPPEQLQADDWGGDMEFQYDHAVYWPALLDICRTKREKKMSRWIAAGKEIGESEEFLAGGTNVSVTGFTYDA